MFAEHLLALRLLLFLQEAIPAGLYCQQSQDSWKSSSTENRVAGAVMQGPLETEPLVPFALGRV